MISRERILEAAGRVYAKHGFRGATTRLIANEAGVNEVTLFRTFGSKSALMEAVFMQQDNPQEDCGLPLDPADPEREIAHFVETNLERVRAIRPLLIHSMGEIDERPEAAEFACRGRQMVHASITNYLRLLQERGLADADADVDTAAVMLVGTVMSDAIARSFVPEVYPPASEAAARYTSCFLRMLGIRKPKNVPTKKSRTTAP
ncbi:MAG: helix-turn-helix domain-containing protein [Gemmatimonadaceae bacterium]